MTPDQKRVWRVLVLLALVCILPITAAQFFYHHRSWLSTDTTNRGHLLVPPIDIQRLHIQNVKPIQGKWALLTLTPEGCRHACQTSLIRTNNLRQLMTKNKGRVITGVLALTPLSTPLEKTIILNTNKQNFVQMVNQYIHVPYALDEGTIYMVDPQGNLMMIYRVNTDTVHLYEDLKHLLKVSQIG